jgi:hypothetical protein
VAYTFDGDNKLVSLTTGILSVTDLWSRWCDWLATGTNSKYLPAFKQVGGDPVDAIAGTSIPIYCFMLNGWKIRPQEASHTLSVTGGILLVEGGGDPFVNTLGSYVVRVNYSQPVQAITVSTGGTAPSAATVAAAVWTETTRALTDKMGFAPNITDIWQHPIEGLYTAEQIIKLMSAVLVGKVTGAETNEISFRDVNDAKSRVRATVDTNGNRTAVIYDVV